MIKTKDVVQLKVNELIPKESLSFINSYFWNTEHIRLWQRLCNQIFRDSNIGIIKWEIWRFNRNV